MKVTNEMVLFWDGIYSNFYPCKFKVGGVNFVTSEQYFMYIKASHFGDKEIAHAILNESNPLYCKQMGRSIANYNEASWDVVRYEIMRDACYAKFSQNEDLKHMLLSTGDKILVEASPYDKIWGIGRYEDDPKSLNQSTWKGKNLLGEVLMEVREKLRNGGENNG